MAIDAAHLIRRQTLEVAFTGSEAEALALNRRLGGLCTEAIAPAIAQALDRIGSGGEHWTIERISVDAGRLGVYELERDLPAIVAASVEQAVRERAFAAARKGRAASHLAADDGRQARPAEDFERRTPAESLSTAFVHFLETGLLPWWFRLPDGQSLVGAVRALWRDAEGRRSIVSELSANPLTDVMTVRLERQFPRQFLQELVEVIAPEAHAAAKTFIARAELQSLPQAVAAVLQRAVCQAALLQSVSQQAFTPETIASTLLTVLSADGGLHAEAAARAVESHWPGLRRKTTVAGRADTVRLRRSGAASPLAIEDGIHIDCAGVVLLHPFLPQFFEALGIARDGAMIAPARAMGLLHYLGSGEDAAPEHVLLLPKLLCGEPLDNPSPSPLALTAEEKEEADALLLAVIGHWEALGSTSADGLRGGFLARPGKILRRGPDDVLQVESQSYDILLDRLPWGLSAVQLPWMARMLWVEWRR